MRKCFQAALVMACCLAPAAGALASPVAFDSFETYTSGSTVAGDNGGSGFSAAYVSDNSNAVNVATESLSYTNGGVSSSGGNQDLQVTAATTGSNTNIGTNGIDNGTLGRAFAAQTGTVYFSFLLRAGATSTSSNEFVQFGLSNSTGSEPALSVGANGASAAAFYFYERNPAGSSGATNSTMVFSPSQTYLIVGKASKVSGSTDYNEIDLYVDPSSTTEPATALLTKVADSTVSTLSTFDIRTARFTAGDDYSVDNIELGTTFADVVQATPEPASLGLLGFAAVALLGRRRRTPAVRRPV